MTTNNKEVEEKQEEYTELNLAYIDTENALAVARELCLSVGKELYICRQEGSQYVSSEDLYLLRCKLHTIQNALTDFSMHLPVFE